jgi:hypothetical protein
MSAAVLRLGLAIVFAAGAAGCVEHWSILPRPQPQPPRPAAAPTETLAVVPFDTLGGATIQDAGRIVAEKLMPQFQAQYKVIDQMSLQRFLDEDGLRQADLMELVKNPANPSLQAKAVKLRAIQLLVVGTISHLPSGRFSVTARVCNWQTGEIQPGGIGDIDADNWDDLMDKMPALAGQMLPAEDEGGADGSTIAPPPDTISLKFTQPAAGRLKILDAPFLWKWYYPENRRSFTIRPAGVTLYLRKGEYHFSLSVRGHDTLYGVLEVLVVDKNTMSAVFGVKHELFKTSHLQRAWGGEPVLYRYGMESEATGGPGEVEVFRYRLGLRPMW